MSGRAISPAETAQSLEQLVGSLARKGIPLPHEIGTFLVLESCERLIGQPLVIIGAAEVWLSDEGEVMLAAGRPASSEMLAARALVVLLGELLVRSAPGVPQMVLELVERASVDDELKLNVLRDALEATLVPLNRAATRRVLSRLLREARKERERGGSMPAPDSGALDDELDALLGVPAGVPRVEPPPPPSAGEGGAKKAEGRPSASREPRGPRLERLDIDEDQLQEQAPRKQAKPHKPRPAELEPEAEPQARAFGPRDLADDLETMAEARGGSIGSRIALGLLMLTVCLVAAYAVLGREGGRKLLGIAPESPAAAADAAPAAAAPPAKPRYGELRVSSSPARAQVLLLIGKAPAVVHGLPVGIAHELIAISEGRAPARGIVPPDAAWSEDNGALQYELALQLGELKKGGYQDIGATRLPQTARTATGASGSVRVVTSPPGASVYQLIGFTPDVRVENLDVREPAELLVYLSGYEPQRVTLSEGSYKVQDGRLVADLEIALKSR